MPVLRIALAAALLAGSAAACTTIANGSGRAQVRTPASSQPGFPSSAGGTVPVLPPASSGTVPTEMPRPRVCSTPACALLNSYDLGGGFVVSVLGDPMARHGVGVTVLELAMNDTPVYWRVINDEIPAEMVCESAGPLRNCVLVDFVGAHGAVARPIVVADGSLVVGSFVDTDTPTMHAGDLDGDNLVDAYGVQNNYDPSYVDGKVQWQTWQRSNDGTSLRSIGCGPLGRHLGPRPTTLLIGTCSA